MALQQSPIDYIDISSDDEPEDIKMSPEELLRQAQIIHQEQQKLMILHLETCQEQWEKEEREMKFEILAGNSKLAEYKRANDEKDQKINDQMGKISKLYEELGRVKKENEQLKEGELRKMSQEKECEVKHLKRTKKDQANTITALEAQVAELKAKLKVKVEVLEIDENLLDLEKKALEAMRKEKLELEQFKNQMLRALGGNGFLYQGAVAASESASESSDETESPECKPTISSANETVERPKKRQNIGKLEGLTNVEKKSKRGNFF